MVAISLIAMFSVSCTGDHSAVSSSGVKKAVATVKTDLNGNSVEQKAIMERIKRDNDPGSIKHLYIISAYSGQVIIYSTVKGKVTSSGKRLNPSQARDANGFGFRIEFPGSSSYFYTDEVLGDDGAYGSSSEYIFWIDSKGVYHQHYPSGGQIIHISDQPLAIKNVIINMEATDEK